jgi:DUF1680 family protein
MKLQPATLVRACTVIIGVLAFDVRMHAQAYMPEMDNSTVKMKPVIPIRAFAFPLTDVRLTDSRFKTAMQKDSAYLLLLKPDRLLYRFYKHAGLTPKDSVYGGWESEGLSGHTLGHYLSAASMMYAANGNDAFKQRVDYIVQELQRCQQARHSGYVGAIPGEDSIFAKVKRGEIKSSGFDLNGGWSPWYTVHKVMAGLVDAYMLTGNNTALQVVEGMANWTYNTVNHLSDSVRLKMLDCEYGGMNDVLANLYSITGNKKYLQLSYKFTDEFVMGKLAQQIDPLPGKHSNTNVPKAIGAARQYELTGSHADSTIASFFWDRMVRHHSYVIGGNSNYEYCGEADKLNDRLSDNTCETCNTYNMLKLTRHLFAWNPSATLMDYYERALYNHILASQNPTNGMMCYFVPLRMGTHKEFSDSFHTFTCCVGSGIENHAKYAEQIYSTDGKNTVYVNLFIASELNWRQKGWRLSLQSEFPYSDNIQLQLKAAPAAVMQLKIRKPYWCQQPQLSVNGKVVPNITDESGYLVIARQWKAGDVVTLQTPMTLYTEAMPDNADRVAIKYGPVVLAGQLGAQKPDPVWGTPVLLTNQRDVGQWLKAVPGKPLHFAMQKVGQPFDVTLQPFFDTYEGYYSVYWDYFTPADWERKKQEYEAEKKRQQQIEQRTIDHFRVGEMQPERDHQLEATERSYVSDALDRKGREARRDHYFSFNMKVEANGQQALLLTYIGDDKDRLFDIEVDGEKLTTVDWKGGTTGKFYDVEYPLPVSMTQGKSSIRVKVLANHGKTAGRVFGVRTMRMK